MEKSFSKPATDNTPRKGEYVQAPSRHTKDFPLYTPTARGTLLVPSTMSKSDFELLKRQIDACMMVIAVFDCVRGMTPAALQWRLQRLPPGLGRPSQHWPSAYPRSVGCPGGTALLAAQPAQSDGGRVLGRCWFLGLRRFWRLAPRYRERGPSLDGSFCLLERLGIPEV